jgi:Protein of unknown function (DUF3306)
MSIDRDESRESFLGRWSRVKIEAREAEAAPAAPPAAPSPAQDEPPELPALDQLTIDSDYRGFFHPKVGEDVRRNALRKLFSDPQFNVMDGLDVYIDDYSKSEPIPAAMLAGLKHAQRIIEWAAETDEEAAVRRSVPPVLPGADEDDETPEAALEAPEAAAASSLPEREPQPEPLTPPAATGKT